MFDDLGNAEEFCSHVFRTFDSDNNGFIDFKEFLLAIDVTSAGSPEQKLNWAFRFDPNLQVLIFELLFPSLPFTLIVISSFFVHLYFYFCWH